MANDYISTILGLGNDQLSTQYELAFPNGIPGGATADEMRDIMLRTQGSFTIPNEGVGSYESFYKGLKVNRPNGLDESTKELTIDVRVDELWGVYDAFKNWKNQVFNPLGGTVGNVKSDYADANNIATLLQVNALSTRTHEVIKSFYFHYTILRDIAISAFDYSSGEPVVLTLTFTFYIMSRSSTLSSASADATADSATT